MFIQKHYVIAKICALLITINIGILVYIFFVSNKNYDITVENQYKLMDNNKFVINSYLLVDDYQIYCANYSNYNVEGASFISFYLNGHVKYKEIIHDNCLSLFSPTDFGDVVILLSIGGISYNIKVFNIHNCIIKIFDINSRIPPSIDYSDSTSRFPVIKINSEGKLISYRYNQKTKEYRRVGSTNTTRSITASPPSVPMDACSNG